MKWTLPSNYAEVLSCAFVISCHILLGRGFYCVSVNVNVKIIRKGYISDILHIYNEYTTDKSAISSKSVEIVAEETAESLKALLIKALRYYFCNFNFKRTRSYQRFYLNYYLIL